MINDALVVPSFTAHRNVRDNAIKRWSLVKYRRAERVSMPVSLQHPLPISAVVSPNVKAKLQIDRQLARRG
jgi:hypothetical protein